MSERPLNEMPLRDLFVHVEHQARDLADHLDLNFLPKLYSLDESVHPKEGTASEARDITVRNRTTEVLESDKFTQQILQKIHDCLNAINEALLRRTE